MSDVRHRHFVLAIELFFEREEHDHAIDVLGDVPHASLAPRPHLRRDVVDDAQAELFRAAGDAQIEAGIVDEQHRIRLLRFDALHQLTEDPPEHRQVAEDVEQADESDLAGVMEQRHPFAREQISADAEHFERGLELLQLANDFGSVEIAGSLAGDDGELHLPPPGDAAAGRRRASRRGRRRSEAGTPPSRRLSRRRLAASALALICKAPGTSASRG